jgi:hypothetical protein
VSEEPTAIFFWHPIFRSLWSLKLGNEPIHPEPKDPLRMSLINEALKKAQRQRTQEVTPSSSTGSPPCPEGTSPPRRVVKRSQPMPAQTLVIVGAACVIIVGVVAAGFWFLIGPSGNSTNTSAPMVVGSAKPAPSTATTPSVAGTAPAGMVGAQPEQTRAPGTAATAGTTVSGTNAAVTPTPVGGVASFVFDVKMADPKAESATAGAESANSSPSDPATAGTAQEETGEGALHIEVPASETGFVPPNSRSSAIVDTLRVSGIRASGTDPKVLMNERVYRLNDVIDHSIGLRLKEINPNNLVFIDETGATYVRNF